MSTLHNGVQESPHDIDGAGASKEAVGKAVKRMEETSRKAYHQLWIKNCKAHRKLKVREGSAGKKSDR